MDFPPVPRIGSVNIITQVHINGSGFTISTGEITTLKHEIRDNTMEGGSCVSETILASGELTEIPGGPGDDIIVEFEDDAASTCTVNSDIELYFEFGPELFMSALQFCT